MVRMSHRELAASQRVNTAVTLKFAAKRAGEEWRHIDCVAAALHPVCAFVVLEP